MRFSLMLFLLSTTILAIFPATSLGSDRGVPGEVSYFRGLLQSPGGPLPFGLEVRRSDSESSGFILNAEERIPVKNILWTEKRLVVRFDHYASIVQTEKGADGVYRGKWTKRGSTGNSVLNASFEPAADSSFLRFRKDQPSASSETPTSSETPALSGEWAVEFLGVTGDDPSPAVARFKVVGDRVTGTFLTPVGDYRYLEGDYRDGLLRLSCFDGAHAFLFHASVARDGASILGDFWSRDRWHEKWRARRADDSPLPPMPDPFKMTEVVDGKTFGFRFPDLDGAPVSLADPRFDGKAILVEIFGSWCPNCHDAAPVLRRFKEKYCEQELEIVSLAYEMTGNPKKDRDQVRRYKERYGCDWTFLLAGTSSKKEASKTLPTLTEIKSYPTTIFLDRDRRVRAIYTGFAGPATGDDHKKLLQEWDTIIQRILKP